MLSSARSRAAVCGDVVGGIRERRVCVCEVGEDEDVGVGFGLDPTISVAWPDVSGVSGPVFGCAAGGTGLRRTTTGEGRVGVICIIGAGLL